MACQLHRFVHAAGPVSAKVERHIHESKLLQFIGYRIVKFERFFELILKDLDPRDIFMYPDPELFESQALKIVFGIPYTPEACSRDLVFERESRRQACEARLVPGRKAETF